ncbi:recombinase family protein [Acutalibacter sp. 1XD8-33]|uniref:recombinase family protein n=1 Tax=Acutalibacter sp. 1XD8-33 TaxID=2320081 RepID=UPI000EA0CB24|nr:recombinase family protein [Acutalibacter sp. 1XD8-33]RKJ38134.1 recombinase family protein [Acutalibacter sp. 1XD8-33]
MEQKRAWIYCRLALNGPESAELLTAQRSRLETYAKEQSFEIVGTSSDIASGIGFDNRTGLVEFQNEAADGNVDILLVSDLSRLGQASEATLQYWFLLRDFNVSVHTADSGKVDMSVDPIIEKILSWA